MRLDRVRAPGRSWVPLLYQPPAGIYYTGISRPTREEDVKEGKKSKPRAIGSARLWLIGTPFFFAILFSLPPRTAKAGCEDLHCCWDVRPLSPKMNLAVALVEVKERQLNGVTLALLDSSIYCEEDLDCSGVTFPLEVTFYKSDYPWACARCEDLDPGDRIMAMVDVVAAVILQYAHLDGDAGVQCFWNTDETVDVNFALQHALHPACVSAYGINYGPVYDCHGEATEGCATAGTGEALWPILLSPFIVGLNRWRRVARREAANGSGRYPLPG